MDSTREADTSVSETSSSTSNRNAFIFGFTPQAELWNGRLAMLGFVIVFLSEVLIHGAK